MKNKGKKNLHLSSDWPFFDTFFDVFEIQKIGLYTLSFLLQLDLIFITVFVSGEKVIKYVGVSDKIDGNWNERKPPFLTMYSCAQNKPTFTLIMKQIKVQSTTQKQF